MDDTKFAIVVEQKLFGYYRVFAVKHCMCEDGKRRYARVTSEPDTFFSLPASVTVRGKSVSGFISLLQDGDYQFTAYTYGKNAHLLKGV